MSMKFDVGFNAVDNDMSVSYQSRHSHSMSKLARNLIYSRRACRDQSACIYLEWTSPFICITAAVVKKQVQGYKMLEAASSICYPLVDCL